MCLARDDPASAEGCSNSPRIWDFGMLVSLRPGVCESLEEREAMKVWGNPGFDMPLSYMACCHWQRRTSSLFSYESNTDKMSEVQLRRLSLTHRRTPDDRAIGDPILTGYPTF